MVENAASNETKGRFLFRNRTQTSVLHLKRKRPYCYHLSQHMINCRTNVLGRLAGKKVCKTVIFSILGILSLFALYLVLLRHPGFFFRHSLTRGGITLYSDEPIPARSAEHVLKAVEQRLARSPLFHPRSTGGIRAYICNRKWRFVLFANFRFHVGGLTYPPLSNNIFLRAADLDADRLIGPSGKAVPGERTLTYFIAHEIAHTLVADELGASLIGGSRTGKTRDMRTTWPKLRFSTSRHWTTFAAAIEKWTR
jgi:hypothetical protein